MKIIEIVAEKIKDSTPVRIIVASFILVILVGSVLLSLPFSSKGTPVPFLDAAFTATSATCVTGLSLFDTYQTFTVIGQAVILVLIQVGGLGLATFVTAFTLLFRKKLGYKNLLLVSESAGTSNLYINALLVMIMKFTFISEAIGAGLLMIRFVPEYGLQGFWSAVFVAVSAFCNAGFDILGFIPGNSSMTAFVNDPLVSLTVSLLIFVGSLGFIVVNDIYLSKISTRLKHKEPARLNFHSQVCLRMAIILLSVGAVAFFVFEYNNTVESLNPAEKALASVFHSVNTRTAGFASVDMAATAESTKLVTIALMFIGGSPGSTAGGIKVTTILVLIATIISTMKGSTDSSLWGHRFNKKVVYKSLSVVCMALALIIVESIVIISSQHSAGTLNVLFEATSAFGTVGLSTGVTAQLNTVGKLIVMFTMFIGRVGPATFGIAVLTRQKKGAESILPEGRMLVG